jgi:hypothetical protein
VTSQVPQETKEPANSGPEPSRGRLARWHKKVLSLCLVTFAIEIGLFLVLYPWSRHWDLNFIPVRVPELEDLWMNPFFRGAVSGLGLLDVWIAGAEFWKLLTRR